MDKVYLKGHPIRSWLSETVNLEVYFNTFSDSCASVFNEESRSIKDIMETVIPFNLSVGKKELKELCDITNTNQLRVNSTSKGNKNAIYKKKTMKSNYKKNPMPTTGKPLNQNNLYASTVDLSKNNVQSNTHAIFSQSDEGLIDKPLASSDPHRLLENATDETKLGEHLATAGIKRNNTDVLTEDIKQDYSSENDVNLPEVCKYQGFKKSRYKRSILTSRRELLLEVPDDENRKNLKKRSDFIVSFRIHKPFSHYEDIENFQQEILMLGHQTLDCLRDKIICESDFQDVQGDISNNPDKPVTLMSRDVYKSAMFYFDNKFYIDSRYRCHKDYSLVIKNWALPRGIKVGNTYEMTEQTVEQVPLRFGYPYLYIHQGSCEHLVIVNDARLLTGKDSLYLKDYPLLSRIPRPITQFCVVCLTHLAMWIVVENSRMLYDISYMCQVCFKMYNYIKGEKCSHFKAYHFYQKNMLL